MIVPLYPLSVSGFLLLLLSLFVCWLVAVVVVVVVVFATIECDFCCNY